MPRPKGGPTPKYPFTKMHKRERYYFKGLKTFLRAKWAARKVGNYYDKKFGTRANGKEGGWIWRVS